MNTKEMAMKYRMAVWTQEISERVSNGEEIKEFCKRKGISKNTYFYWQRKIRQTMVERLMPEEAGTVAPIKREPVLPCAVKTPMPVPSGWRQIEAAEPAQAEVNEVRIEIGKCRITAKDTTNTELLSKVCKVLVEIC